MQTGEDLESPGKVSGVNIFSSALPTDQMVRLTTEGGEECGAPGDLLSWAEAEWELQALASSHNMSAAEGPCRPHRESPAVPKECRVGSEEPRCKMAMVLGPGYDRFLPPVDSLVRTVPVGLSIALHGMARVEGAKDQMAVTFTTILQWRETGRVTYHNLKGESALNGLTEEGIRQLWLPIILFTNLGKAGSTRLQERMVGVTVVREEEDLDRTGDDLEIFRGDRNTLTMNQTITFEIPFSYNQVAN
jgi:hypothetical protein